MKYIAAVNEDGLAHPEVHITFTCLWDKDPQFLLENVSVEWRKLGGNKLYLKNVAAYRKVTPVVIFSYDELG